MAFSTDSDLTALVPDILQLGIANFAAEHAKAEADIKRELRNRWWPRTGFNGELDDTLLTESQFTRCNAYLVLWKYALPQLTNWTDGDRFMQMMDFYKARYNEEFNEIIADGVEYDKDDDGTVTNTEKEPKYVGRLVR